MNLLEYGKKELEKHNIDPNLANYLYKYIDDARFYKDGITRLIKGEPIQYILGNVDFYGYIIKVNPSTLIPHFETEELVYKTLNYINKYFDKNVDIADLGTGSGCIAITLSKKLNTSVDAVDISKDALEVAKENAKSLEADVHFYEGNFLDPLTKKYDVIISNPPYIGYDEEIMDIVYKNEPHLALFADHEGLACYEEILSKANYYLNKKSMIAFEIGEGQGQKIKEISLSYFPEANVTIEKDIQGRDRFIFILINVE